MNSLNPFEPESYKIYDIWDVCVPLDPNGYG